MSRFCLYLYFFLSIVHSCHANRSGVPRQPLFRTYRKLTTAASVMFLSGLLVSAQHIDTASDVPSRLLKNKATISGTVFSVIDGDTIRLRHQVLPFIKNFFDRPLTKNTISVRIYAVDCPELGKKGGVKEGQAFSQEAKDFTSKKVLKKYVNVKLLGRDRYGRIIGQVQYRKGFSTEDLSIELVKRGLACVYRGGNAKYGTDKTIGYWNRLEKKAQDRRVGMWENGSSGAELPSIYKQNLVLGKNRDLKVDKNLQSQRQRNYDEERLGSDPEGSSSLSRRGIRKSRYLGKQPNQVAKGKAPGGTIFNDPNCIFKSS